MLTTRIVKNECDRLECWFIWVAANCKFFLPARNNLYASSSDVTGSSVRSSIKNELCFYLYNNYRSHRKYIQVFTFYVSITVSILHETKLFAPFIFCNGGRLQQVVHTLVINFGKRNPDTIYSRVGIHWIWIECITGWINNTTTQTHF